MINERVNNIIVKSTYYYDSNTKKSITKYSQILTKNLEYLKKTEIVYE